MSFLERQDNEWLDVALDPKKRAQLVTQLAVARGRLFSILVIWGVLSLVVIMLSIISKSLTAMTPFVVNGAFLLGFFGLLFSFSDLSNQLRLLKLVARLQPSPETGSSFPNLFRDDGQSNNFPESQ